MSNLISGKEALIALANGEEVELQVSLGEWGNAGVNTYAIGLFLNDYYKFRLKPKTITLNGIEIPACGSDYKPHTFMFVLNSLETCEYSKVILDESDEIPPYWWQTEDEIRQVVEALRSIFKGA